MVDPATTAVGTKSPEISQNHITSPIGTRPLLRANMHPPSVTLKQSLLPFSLTTTKPQTPSIPLSTQPNTVTPAELSIVQPTSALGLAVEPTQIPQPPTSTDLPPPTNPNSTSDSPAHPSTSTLPLPTPPVSALDPTASPASAAAASLDPPPRRLGPGGVAVRPRAKPYAVCAFCMGPSGKNKFGRKEAMVSCYECGSSGHPSCCGFDDGRMVRNVRSYNWCCGDCTRCEVCDVKGEDNDETVSE